MNRSSNLSRSEVSWSSSPTPAGIIAWASESPVAEYCFSNIPQRKTFQPPHHDAGGMRMSVMV
jgi:hypothetical protein